MNKILDNLNKYIKDDLVHWIKSNIKYKIYSLEEIEIVIASDFSKFNEISICVDLRLNNKLCSFYIKYSNNCDSYALEIQNISLGINLRFKYSIKNEKELFRIINLFSECFLNGHYIHDESFFYEGGSDD